MTNGKAQQSAMVQFVIGTGMFAVVWFFGLALKASIWGTDIEWVRRSGVSSILKGGVSPMMSVVLVLLVAGACYGLALYALRTDFPHRMAFAVAGGLLLAGVALPATPLTSPDTTHFAADVRTLWLHGKNPTRLANVPRNIDDPVAKEVRTFNGSPSGYGPVAYAIGGIPIPFVGDGLRANVFGQKVLSGTMLILTALGAAAVAKRLGRNAPQTFAAIAMNPMFVWQFPGDGHNDAIMAAFGTISLVFIIQKPWRKRGAGLGLALLSVLTKYSVAIVAPVILTAWFPKYRRIIGGLVGIGGLAALVVFFGVAKPRVATIGPLEGVTRNTPWNFIFDGFNLTGTAHDVVIAICYGGALLVIAAICLFHKFETEQDIIDAIALALGLFIFLFAPTLRQWYLIWAFPAVMLSSRRWLRWGAISFSLCGLMTTIALNWNVTLGRTVGIPRPIELAVTLAWLIPLAVAYSRWKLDDPNRPTAPQRSRQARRAATNQRRRMTAR